MELAPYIISIRFLLCQHLIVFYIRYNSFLYYYLDSLGI